MIEMRSATTADTSEILDLWRDADSVVTVTDDATALENLVTHDPEALTVAEVDGTIVGTVIAAWDGWRGEIYRLAVAPAHRRQGLANRLLDVAVDSLRRRGARRMACIVVGDDFAARGFWDATDFGAQMNRVRYVHPPDRRVTTVRKDRP